ncbi:MAG TPA: hydantoinase/oxoprolinase family protein, partial [Roseobacter sp.]|nr:hydantoinase/oxoprolinase family protein [Roseobacter sp.]
QDFSDQNSALALLEQALRSKAQADAAAAGAADIQVTAQRDIRTAGVENREVFIEAIVTVEATGRPRVAVG